MEKSIKTLEYKIEQYKNAVNDFKTSLEIDISAFEPSIADTLKSGQVQKFEVCADLMWKTIRMFLLEVNGVECISPKQAVKEFYNLSYVSIQEYESELDILDDRNSLSHIYNKAQFEVLYTRVHTALPVFLKVLNEIQT